MMRSVLVVLLAFGACTIAWPNVESFFTSGTSRYVVNGFAARRNQFPYQAALHVYSKAGSGFCGGSIITNQHILSAAHCTTLPVERVYVRVGSLKLGSGGISMIVPKANIINHPHYDRLKLINDISVLRLPIKLQFSSSIQPIRLPSVSIARQTFENAYARVSGWGSNSYGGGSVDELRFVDMQVIPNSQCHQFFKRTLRITDSILCAVGPHAHLHSGQNQGTCSGDSGGPLVIQNSNGILIQIGIVSFATKGDCLRKPNGFVRTGLYLDFIRAAVSGQNAN